MSQKFNNTSKQSHVISNPHPVNLISQDSLFTFDFAHNNPQIKQNPSSPNRLTKMQCPNSPEIFKTIKNFITQISCDSMVKNDAKIDIDFDKQLQQTKMLTSLNNQISFYRQSFGTQQKKIKQLESNWEKTTKQNQNKYRKEIKKYIDLLNQRQNQIQNLKKSIKALNNKNLSLTNQIQNITQTKNTFENAFIKSVQNIKANIKQFNYSIHQNELDKVVLEGKYKQLCDKVQQVVKQSQDIQNQKIKIEKKYDRLKESYETSKNECIELKFQIERLKIKINDLKEGNQTKNKNTLNGIQKLGNQLNKQKIPTLSMLKDMTMDLMENINKINQSRDKFAQVQAVTLKINELINQNQNLKIDLKSKQIQIDQLQLKNEGPIYQDQILKNRNPSLYEILNEKKNKIQQFENKIIEIQNIALRAEQLLLKNINQVPIVSQPNNTESLQIPNNQSQNKTKVKLSNDQLIQQIQIQKQKAIAQQRQNNQKLRERDRKIIQQLENKYETLKKQNQKLNKLNQQLEKQKRKLKNQLIQLNQEFHQKRKKGGKTKGKLKCCVCHTDIIGNKSAKCSECFKKMHNDCQKIHQCSDKITQSDYSQENSQQ